MWSALASIVLGAVGWGVTRLLFEPMKEIIAPSELLDNISPMRVDMKGSGHMHFGAYGRPATSIE
jgi:hypothetical protein